MKEYPIVLKAADFAYEAHKGQLRKYTGLPYIQHPVNVCAIVESAGGTAEMQAAALLHDVVEDCGVTFNTIEKEFGYEVACLVKELTSASLMLNFQGNRKERKDFDARYIGLYASPAAKTIKLADLIDNTESIVQHDSKFAKVYLEEKYVLLGHLMQRNTELWLKAYTICVRGLYGHLL